MPFTGLAELIRGQAEYDSSVDAEKTATLHRLAVWNAYKKQLVTGAYTTLLAVIWLRPYLGEKSGLRCAILVAVTKIAKEDIRVHYIQGVDILVPHNDDSQVKLRSLLKTLIEWHCEGLKGYARNHDQAWVIE